MHSHVFSTKVDQERGSIHKKKNLFPDFSLAYRTIAYKTRLHVITCTCIYQYWHLLHPVKDQNKMNIAVCNPKAIVNCSDSAGQRGVFFKQPGSSCFCQTSTVRFGPNDITFF